jgi:hypothetical protein
MLLRHCKVAKNEVNLVYFILKIIMALPKANSVDGLSSGLFANN